MQLKALERANKLFWLRLLTRYLRRSAARDLPRWDARPYRVLFLRHDRIGDMILSTGAFRAIAASHPTLQLDVLASPINAPIIAHEPAVHEVVLFRKGRLREYPAFVRRLRARRYDVVVDCMVTAPSLTTLLLIWASGARHRVGVAGRGNDDAFTLLTPVLPWARHISQQLVGLAAAFGVTPTPALARPRLHLTAEELEQAEAIWRAAGAGSDTPRMLLNISAGLEKRRWPDERYVAVVREALARHPALRVLGISAPADRARLAAIAAATGIATAETRTIRDAIALVAAADCVFTPDTSIAHAASALDVPGVSMHLVDTSVQWALLGDDSANVSGPTKRLESLSLEPVQGAVLQLLDRVLGGRRARGVGRERREPAR